MYYPLSENEGANKLRGYREADLRLCFRICKKPVFSRGGSNNVLNTSALTLSREQVTTTMHFSLK